jgi:hypothetical protein
MKKGTNAGLAKIIYPGLVFWHYLDGEIGFHVREHRAVYGRRTERD